MIVIVMTSSSFGLGGGDSELAFGSGGFAGLRRKLMKEMISYKQASDSFSSLSILWVSSIHIQVPTTTTTTTASVYIAIK